MTPPTAAKEQQQQQQPGGEDGEGSLDRSSSQYGLESCESLDSSTTTVVEHSPQGRYVRFNAPLVGGAYKEVWKAYDTSEGVEVAWNTLFLEDIPVLDKKRIIQEIKVLEKVSVYTEEADGGLQRSSHRTAVVHCCSHLHQLDHPNIISFYTSWYNREQKQIVFITELMNSGSLLDFVKPVALRWKIVKRWAKQILDGLVHLHAQQPAIIHRNINCDNIFIVANKSQLKIGDLGLSTVARSENCVGTAPFMAPELYEEAYDEKVDIYAFGMTLLQMIVKETPYSECGENVGELYRRVTSHIPPEGLACIENENARRFIELCLSPDPADRPTAAELSDHPFLKENKDEDGLEVLLSGRPIRGHMDRSEGAPLLRSDTSLDSIFTRRPSGSKVTELPAASSHQQEDDSGKGSNSIVTANGSKLHMRFFSEPPVPSFSEISVSDDESDLEVFFSNDGASSVSRDDESGRSNMDDDSLSRSGVRSVQQGSYSPRSAWKVENRGSMEDDDLLCGLPEAESTCKKVKVMGGRNKELEEDTESNKAAVLPSSPPKSPRSYRDILAAPAPSASAPAPSASDAKLSAPCGPASSRSGASTPVVSTPVVLSPSKGPDAVADAKGEQGTPARPTPLVTQLSNSSETNSVSPPGESRHSRVPGSLTTVASYDISIRSTSDSSDSSTCSGPASPIKSQTSTPPGSPVGGGSRYGQNQVGITKEAMDVLQCISRHQQRQEQRQQQQQHQQEQSSTSSSPTNARPNNVMTLVIRTPLLGKLNLVEFEFNLSTDDPQQVAREMVTELGIPETDMEDMAMHIAVFKEKELARRAAKTEARAMAPVAIKPVLSAPQPIKVPDKKEASPARPCPLPGRPERKEIAPQLVLADPTSSSTGCCKPPPCGLVRRPSATSLTAVAPCTHARNVSTGSRMQRLPSEKHLLAALQQQQPASTATTPVSVVASSPAPPLPVSRSSSNDSLLGSSKGNGGGARVMVSAPSACSLFGSNPRNDTDEELDNLSHAEVETDDSLDDDDDEMDEEFQKLKREYLKSRERCLKVFKQRMESMEQCWRDKEESHRKQQEKHLKAMLDFDRRQDVFRNEQLQREVDMDEQWNSVIEQHRETMKARRGSQLLSSSTAGGGVV